jgi:hypothetical protein
MCRNFLDADWAKHVLDYIGAAKVDKGNQTLYNHISNLTPNKNLFYFVSQHLQLNWLYAHAEIFQ